MAEITQDIVDRVEQENYYRFITGQPAIPTPQVGGDPLDWLTQLTLNSDGTMAADMADQFGISQEEINANASRIDAEAQERRIHGFNPLERALYSSGDRMIEAGPWGTALTLGAIGFGGAQLGAFGGTAGAGGYGAAAIPGLEVAPNGLLTGAASAAGGGVGTLGGAVPAVGAYPGLGIGLGGLTVGPNGMPTGAASAAGGGVGTMSGSVPAVGAYPGLAGAGAALPVGTEIGPNGMPTGPAAAAGGGVGTLSGAVPAVGAAPGLVSGLTGAATTAATNTAGGSTLGDVLGGAGNGLGLGGWLTLGSLAAQALQGNQDITTTSIQEPPAYLKPYLADAAGQAQTLYGQGNYVAPVQQAAIDYGTNVLNGNYLNSNPYLDATYNMAADRSQNRLTSEYARAGRNIDASAPARAGMLSDLAAQIYGGNYQAERDRMQQIVPQAGQLGAYTNPGVGLDDYISRLRNLGGGYGTSTSSTPTESNWLSGLAGLGLALMPPGG